MSGTITGDGLEYYQRERFGLLHSGVGVLITFQLSGDQRAHLIRTVDDWVRLRVRPKLCAKVADCSLDR